MLRVLWLDTLRPPTGATQNVWTRFVRLCFQAARLSEGVLQTGPGWSAPNVLSTSPRSGPGLWKGSGINPGGAGTRGSQKGASSAKGILRVPCREPRVGGCCFVVPPGCFPRLQNVTSSAAACSADVFDIIYGVGTLASALATAEQECEERRDRLKWKRRVERGPGLQRQLFSTWGDFHLGEWRTKVESRRTI